ncbi:CueP family metal-binding protein [Microbacterium karelineae]|uniref:CueP family metal-binding protein n=1 Tax=Microbacterium karelineae TaxID=2654283 RepID=UPI0012EACAEC|nr:CueP family metal-binding protein [Microbacterium karelineae]
MNNRIAATAALTLTLTPALLLASCAAPDEAPRADEPSIESGAGSELLQTWELDGLDASQIITRLDEMPVAERPEALIASIQPDEIIISDDSGAEARVAMPEDETYLAIAPFREHTHECYFHSLTTCLGELGDSEVQVTLETDEGEVLVDETRVTYDNGFVGLWVPRGIEGTLTIEQGGDAGRVEIATTGDDDPTCITGLQLS